ncbi:DUF6082 family protein [Kitasatospora sp. NPDC092286]|uniref:DUF6082 family protein n=1 Tax=Kitasatospora sp. NPDC092286 TaxID=3364087 RepID=UPI003819C950
MKTSNAVLFLAGVGAGRAALAYWQHREMIALKTAAMHQAMLSDMAADPALTGFYAPYEGVPEDQRVREIHVNRQLALLEAKFRVGRLTHEELKINIWNLAEHPAARDYWQRSGEFRLYEATTSDRTARRFTQLLKESFDAAVHRHERLAAALVDAAREADAEDEQRRTQLADDEHQNDTVAAEAEHQGDSERELAP